MQHFPIVYDEPLFRPPSEGNSLIIQVTLGCSWNNCAFCEMYTSKQFRPRNEADILNDIEACNPFADQIQKVFLADGDPMVLSTKRLLPILEKISNTFPKLRRISAYATPSNLRKKSENELNELKDAGLKLVYVGIESGDDEVLECLQKGETFSSTVQGINNAHAAGIESSVMIINGVGGKALSTGHALNSARVLNEVQPKFASTLVLTAHKGMEHFQSRFKGNFEPMNWEELFREMKLFMENLELKESIFRSDHASNFLVLKGILNKDKQRILEQIEDALTQVKGTKNLPHHGPGGGY